MFMTISPDVKWVQNYLAGLLNLSTFDGQTLFLKGQWCRSSSVADFVSCNPATGEVLAFVADASPQDTEIAIQSVAQEFLSWKNTLVHERASLLRRWAQLLTEHLENLARLLHLEQGKPITEALAEIRSGIEAVEWAAEEARRLYGTLIPSYRADQELSVEQKPVGPVLAITPWNFPQSMILRKVAPALAAGCTVVLKPSEETPLCAVALMALAQQAGLPNGVLSLVTLSRENLLQQTDRLIAHPSIRKISFTGSTQVGKFLMEKSAQTLKHLSLELGGNAPFIVTEQADLEKAGTGLVACKFRNAGQTCISANRVFVHQDVHDNFVTILKEKMKDLALPPLINKSAIEKVCRHVENAIAQGAECLFGGRIMAERQNYFQPTLLVNMQDTMAIACEETFGPVVAIWTYKDQNDLINKVNQSQHGLAAYIYSEDLKQAKFLAQSIESGMISINSPFLAHATIPFGGVKESGFGREGGPNSLQDFLEKKFISIQN
jgi:succinate-semialdehyde dehydrogenase / glutarate-semialdehyde dehydrogenase